MSELHAPIGGALSDTRICLAVITVLVAKASGRVDLTQADFDWAAGKILLEHLDSMPESFALEVVADATPLS